jgi:hypothetical protein
MKDTYRQILDLLRRLREAKIHYRLYQSRDDALMIEVTVPGERWEIEFVDYGDEVQVEVERFVSGGHLDDESALEDLFARYSDADTPSGEEATRT